MTGIFGVESEREFHCDCDDCSHPACGSSRSTHNLHLQYKLRLKFETHKAYLKMAMKKTHEKNKESRLQIGTEIWRTSDLTICMTRTHETSKESRQDKEIRKNPQSQAMNDKFWDLSGMLKDSGPKGKSWWGWSWFQWEGFFSWRPGHRHSSTCSDLLANELTLQHLDLTGTYATHAFISTLLNHHLPEWHQFSSLSVQLLSLLPPVTLAFLFSLSSQLAQLLSCLPTHKVILLFLF